MTCPYVTTLERPCGRPLADGNEHCPFHASLVQLEIEFEKELCR